jgi:hypothetical protein
MIRRKALVVVVLVLLICSSAPSPIIQSRTIQLEDNLQKAESELSPSIDNMTGSPKNNTLISHPNFPRNITDIYKGSWKFDETKANINEALWVFEKNHGGSLFHLASRPTNETTTDSSVALVIGYFDLRDGIFSTDAYLKYHLFGIHVYREGLLRLLAIPDDPRFGMLEDELHEQLKFNHTLHTQIKENFDFGEAQEKLTIDCYLLVEFQIDPLLPELVVLMENRPAPFDPRYRTENDPAIAMSFSIISPACRFALTGKHNENLPPEVQLLSFSLVERKDHCMIF